MNLLKRIAIIISGFFLLYAIFGMIGSGFRYMPIVLLMVFTSSVLVAFLYTNFSGLNHSPPPILVSVSRMLVFVTFPAILFWPFLDPVTGKRLLDWILDHWQSLPPFAKISPTISTSCSVCALVLSYLAHRRSVRDERRKLDEWQKNENDKSSPIVKPSTQEIRRYGRGTDPKKR